MRRNNSMPERIKIIPLSERHPFLYQKYHTLPPSPLLLLPLPPPPPRHPHSNQNHPPPWIQTCPNLHSCDSHNCYLTTSPPMWTQRSSSHPSPPRKQHISSI